MREKFQLNNYISLFVLVCLTVNKTLNLFIVLKDMPSSLNFKIIRSARLRLQTPVPNSSGIYEYIWVLLQLA